MSLADGFLFGYLRRQAIEERKVAANADFELEKMTAQRDALREVVRTLVPEEGVRNIYVTPLYRKILRQEYKNRHIPLPNWLKP